VTTNTVRPQDVPARPWLTADAERWAAARLPVWARATWPVLVLVAASVTALALSPELPGPAAVPYGMEWIATGVFFLFLCHLLWLWLIPELALLSAPLLLAVMGDSDVWAGGAGERAADIAVVVALCWCCASTALLLRVRRRQHALALDAAGGLTFDVPEPAAPPRRGRALIIIGLSFLAVTAAVTALSVLAVRSDEANVSAAVRVDAVVVGRVPEKAIYVRFTSGTPDGRHRVQTSQPERYPLDSTVRVLLHGTWMRLPAEPYRDLPDRQLGAAALGALGLTLLAFGLRVAVRARSLVRTPAPALRVLTRRRSGRTQIYAADDTNGLRPFISYEPRGESSPKLREAVLYGPAYAGAEHVLLSTRKSGEPVVETSGTPAWREGPPDQERERERPEPRKKKQRKGPTRAQRRANEHQRATHALTARALATMGPAKGPVRWQSGPLARTVGTLLLVAAVAVLTGLFLDIRQVGTGHLLMALCGCVVLALQAAFAILWRITADASGLRIRRLTRTWHLPWADVRHAAYTRDGRLVVRARKGVDDIDLHEVGLPRAERAFRRPGRAARAAVEINAMVRDPGLRPSA